MTKSIMMTNQISQVDRVLSRREVQECIYLLTGCNITSSDAIGLRPIFTNRLQHLQQYKNLFSHDHLNTRDRFINTPRYRSSSTHGSEPADVQEIEAQGAFDLGPIRITARFVYIYKHVKRIQFSFTNYKQVLKVH